MRSATHVRNAFSRSRHVAVLVAVLLIVESLAVVAQSEDSGAAGPLTRTPPAYGIQFHGLWNMYYSSPTSATPNAMFWSHLDQFKKNAISVVRLDVAWSDSQPTRVWPNPSYYFNQRIALVVKEAAARGLKLLITLYQSPAWARGGQGDVASFPTDPAAIKPWIAWMVKSFGSKVLGWEVWNEPNLLDFTGISQPDQRVQRYVPLLKAVHDTAKVVNKKAVIVFGGTSFIDTDFIGAAYAAGAKRYFDVMAVHPYQGDETKPPASQDIYDKTRMTYFPALIALMKQYGDAQKPVWWTELGFSVHDNTGIDPNEPWLLGLPNPEIAGYFLKGSFELARESYPQVRMAIVYTAYKASTDPRQFGYRLFEADGTPLAQVGILRNYMKHFPGSAPLFGPTPA